MDDLSQKSSSRVFWRSAKFWSAAFVLSAAAGAGYYFYAPRQSEGERPAEAARTGKKGGDSVYFHKLCKIIPKKIWLNEILTQINQDTLVSGKGKKNDIWYDPN